MYKRIKLWKHLRAFYRDMKVSNVNQELGVVQRGSEIEKENLP